MNLPVGFPQHPRPDSEPVRFECTRCGACCSQDNIIVTVTGHDIVRIAKGLGLAAHELLKALDFYLMENKQSLLKGFERFPSFATERGQAYLALRKTDNHHCIFLKDNLCLIHSLRPAVCMSFPFTFEKHGTSIYWGLSANRHICPGLGQGVIVSDVELFQLGALVLEELELFHQFAEEWNQEVKSPTALHLIEKIISDPRFT